MKVIHICSYYYGSKLYQNLFSRLSKKNETIVFAPHSYAADVSPFNQDYLIKAACFKARDRLFFYKKYNKVYKAFAQMNLDADILHAHTVFSNGYIAYKHYLKTGTPYIVTVRNTDINTFFKRIIYLRKLGIQILNHAEKIVFLSEAYKTRLLNMYIPTNKKSAIEAKSVVIPNGIDAYWLADTNTHIKRDLRKLKLVFVGEVNKNKNVKTIVKLIEMELKSKFDVSLQIVGRCNNKALLKLIVEKPYIIYHGKQDKEYIKTLYKDCDIFIMPSISETFGLVYAEAMSQGIPVIYSKGEGFDQQFPDGVVGYGVNCYSIEQMAECINKIMADYNAMSQRCATLSKRYDWDKITDTYEDLFFSIKNKTV